MERGKKGRGSMERDEVIRMKGGKDFAEMHEGRV